MPVKADTSRIDRELQRVSVRMARRCAILFEQEVKRGAPRRTGELVGSIERDDPTVAGDTININVTVGAEYARYVDEGTGIYGPDGRPITPKRPGGVLRFDWPAAGGIVFARRVRGSPPTRFWQKAVAMWPFIVRRVSAGG
jgi:hypothetical protein